MRSTNLLLLAALGLLCLSATATARKTKTFPNLNNCNQTPLTTPFRANVTVNGLTTCFSFYAAPANASEPCGSVTSLERFQIWAKYDQRKTFDATLKTDKTTKEVFGSWANKNGNRDELVFSKLNWTPEFVTKSKPQICITLIRDIKDFYLSNTAGTVTFGLYSPGPRNSKCCPAYSVAV
ncbi:hypothetical protein GPECTOR_18g141 [Gonium pectorale]|uniref:Pherophorin domain-containing protein n=1 Tax=Gonium pectorale TaxID=33097 RepID=A0A150GJK9_GONPE|nr:hypothetical protein GPECTOR_18g141 [Gonium pectorale]|eukprot:KXZ49986.1 hypothetical protein GPECTOR_18g141 [Gonium pectorale]